MIATGKLQTALETVKAADVDGGEEFNAAFAILLQHAELTLAARAHAAGLVWRDPFKGFGKAAQA